MKSYEAKYQEAVDRNIKSALKNKNKYAGKKFEVVKHALGISTKDDRFNDDINIIIADPK